MTTADRISATGSTGPSRATVVIGWIISVLLALLMLAGGTFALLGGEEMAKNFAQLGYPPGVMKPLGIVEILCGVLFLIPRTSMLGAILLTAYLGGATDVHVRAGEIQFLIPVAFGTLAWLGLLLRDARLRTLLPLRT